MAYHEDICVGDRFETKRCGVVTIVEINHANDIVVKFENTGFVKSFAKHNIKNGLIKDPTARLYYGVGYKGVGSYPKQRSTASDPAYSKWRQMLCRCYDEKSRSYRSYGAKGIRVCKDWHNFQNYAEWYEKNYVSGYVLDKDILGRDKRIYSPETCTFVPPEINYLVAQRRGVKEGGMAFGVSRKEKPGNKPLYVCQVRTVKGETAYKGSYPTMHEAFMAYKTIKEAHITGVATHYYKEGKIPHNVYCALINWNILPY